jgi:ketosteroid isomerase-like protein
MVPAISDAQAPRTPDGASGQTLALAPTVAGSPAAVAGTSTPDRSAPSPELARTLLALNQAYIDAFMHSDSAAYNRLLADDFYATNPDGSFVGKSEFLRLAAQPHSVVEFHAEDVKIRVYGTLAIINARTPAVRRDGTRGVTRYTDTWAFRDGEWKAVGAQVTREADGRR